MATTKSTRKRGATKTSKQRTPTKTTKQRNATKTSRQRTAAKTTKQRAAAKATAPKKRSAAKRGPAGVSGAAKKGSPPRERSSGPATGDAIAELKQDHRDVQQLFRRFEKAGDDAHGVKRELVDTMIEELSRHAEIEELVFYPAVRDEVDEADSDVLEALEEHHVVKLVLSELEDLEPTDERFDAKVTVMMESVRHHVKEEEQTLFPEVRRAMRRPRLRELGDELRDAKGRVATRPHPVASGEPTADTLLEGAIASSTAEAAAQRAVDTLP
jgi:hemerythrin-like domain-containing protein